MIYRFLLTFGLLSVLILIDVPGFTPAKSAHASMTTALSDNCNPNDPQSCPQK